MLLAFDPENDDTGAYQAWQAVAGYQPSNRQFDTVSIRANRTALEAAQLAEVQAKAAYDAGHNDAVKAGWDFHHLILGVKISGLVNWAQLQRVSGIGVEEVGAQAAHPQESLTTSRKS